MVVVFLANGFEEIEAITAIDILRRAGLNVQTVSISEDLRVTGAHQMTLVADILFDPWLALNDINEIEAVVLPGGMPGTTNLSTHHPLNELLTRLNAKTIVAAICAAPMVLGELNLLNGKKSTCYPGFETHLRGAQVLEENVVVDLPYITSRGAGTAFEFALTLVKVLKDENTSNQLAESMIYAKKNSH